MKISEEKIVKNFDKEKFAKYLVEHNTTRSELSRKMGHAPSYISDILCGHSILKKNQYNLIVLLLDVPYDTFLLPEEPIKPVNIKTAKIEENTDVTEIKNTLVELNCKMTKMIDQAEKEEVLLGNIDLSLRTIGNFLVQINEKLKP